MIAFVTKEVMIDVKTVLIEINSHHCGGEAGDMAPDFPLLKDGAWSAYVDVDTGAIANWPAGDARELFMWVRDTGAYTLFDGDNDVLEKIQGFVPNGVIPGLGGESIELLISGDGVIINWPKEPDFQEFFNS